MKDCGHPDEETWTGVLTVAYGRENNMIHIQWPDYIDKAILDAGQHRQLALLDLLKDQAAVTEEL